jgi:hypothetical protein
MIRSSQQKAAVSLEPTAASIIKAYDFGLILWVDHHRICTLPASGAKDRWIGIDNLKDPNGAFGAAIPLGAAIELPR